MYQYPCYVCSIVYICKYCVCPHRPYGLLDVGIKVSIYLCHYILNWKKWNRKPSRDCGKREPKTSRDCGKREPKTLTLSPLDWSRNSIVSYMIVLCIPTCLIVFIINAQYTSMVFITHLSPKQFSLDADENYLGVKN